MQRSLVVEFTKMNGAGNDFIVIDNRFYYFSDEELAGIARRFCRRRFGIGADGLLAFSPAVEEGHHYRMRYLNADGSIGTMCGNGARCLVRFGRYAGVEEDEVVFETDAGPVRAYSPAGPSEPVRLYLGTPRRFAPRFELAGGAGERPERDDVHYIWTGTEHLVCFVERAEEAPVGRWGPALRRDRALDPTGANVNFVEVVDEGAGSARPLLRVRTYEKGVEDETYACGTGAIASVVTARLLGRIARDEADVQMHGGVLGVGFEREGEGVEAIRALYLEGPAEVVYRGTFEL